MIIGAIMKKIAAFLLIIFALVSFYTCFDNEGPAGPPGKDGKDGDYDKQICIPFPFTGSYGTSRSQYTYLSSSAIIKFNKNNYIGVDSIIFVPHIDAWMGDDNYCIAEIFNLTDSTEILNSLVKTNSKNRIWVESGNIYDSFPEKEIDICVRFKSLKDGDDYRVGINRAWLFLYRK